MLISINVLRNTIRLLIIFINYLKFKISLYKLLIIFFLNFLFLLYKNIYKIIKRMLLFKKKYLLILKKQIIK